jgi:hypothetical protein
MDVLESFRGNFAWCEPDDSSKALVRRRLAVYQARLDQVHARGGEYLKVDFSEGIKRLLLRLDAGENLSKNVH